MATAPRRDRAWERHRPTFAHWQEKGVWEALLANLGADYQRDKAQLSIAHSAQRDALQAEIHKAMKAAARDLTNVQRQEQQDYRRLWAKRNEARCEAWRACQAKYRPIERERTRYRHQQENLRRIDDRARQLSNRAPRSRGNERER